MGARRKSGDIIGKSVINEEGVTLGEVIDYLIDIDEWAVTDVQVKIEKTVAKELGLKTPFFGSLLVLFSVDLILSAEDNVMLGIERDDIKPYVEERLEFQKAAKKAAKKGKPEPVEEAEGEEGEA
ncbi:MAG: hypothetical protein AAGI01_03930 [Myxococcota bacterium]